MKRLAIVFVVLAVLLLVAWLVMVRMPGASCTGPLPALDAHAQQVRDDLRADVEMLATTIGPRNIVTNSKELDRAADYLEQRLTEAGYQPTRQKFDVPQFQAVCYNVEAELQGSDPAAGVIIVGGHYDSVPANDCPGANDNASGTAGMLALARALHGANPRRTIRFVGWPNEEAPGFQAPSMGSWVHAKACRERGDNVVGAISLECLGYYTDQPGSQQYPLPGINLFYPRVGNFIAFIGDIRSRPFVHQSIAAFRAHAQFPSQGMAALNAIPGVGWSDHWSYWQEGYPALMVTDTAFNRNANYHQRTDTADTIDYDRMALVVVGLEQMLRELAENSDRHSFSRSR